MPATRLPGLVPAARLPGPVPVARLGAGCRLPGQPSSIPAFWYSGILLLWYSGIPISMPYEGLDRARSGPAKVCNDGRSSGYPFSLRRTRSDLAGNRVSWTGGPGRLCFRNKKSESKNKFRAGRAGPAIFSIHFFFVFFVCWSEAAPLKELERMDSSDPHLSRATSRYVEPGPASRAGCAIEKKQFRQVPGLARLPGLVPAPRLPGRPICFCLFVILLVKFDNI